MNHPPLTAKAVFDHAHEITSPAERKAYLDQACADAPELRQKVEALLQAFDEAGSFLQTPAIPPQDTGASQPGNDTSDHVSCVDAKTVPPRANAAHTLPSEGPGAQIGTYTLVAELGEGGMGAVYLAKQEQPMRREVALKIIKPGMDSAAIVARFEAERQALTMMEHPNIARVFDAGTTETGRPYFVMELVKGVPMTRYCNENTLTLRERLQLFETVCQAIQHAHTKGIMHRDIKPSNVLVAMQDGKPVAKVIDFGLAKATEQPLTDQSNLTESGAIVGTLEYMSPEQADPRSGAVDTRTDIYSLGVMLYELLTGTTPLDRSTLRGAGIIDMLVRISQEEAPKPSVRVAGLGEVLGKIAAERKSEPARLAKQLRNELDWIAMKALEKDRNRRYETASGFAKDVQRYLDDEPVEACPPSVRYRLGKFARKNRVLVGFVGLLAVGVVGLTLGLFEVNNAWQREVIEKEKAIAAENFAVIEKEKAVAAEKKAVAVEKIAVRAEKGTSEALAMTESVLQTLTRNRPKLNPIEQSTLRILVQHYRNILQEPEVTQESRAWLAGTQLRLANIYAILDERPNANSGYRQAIQRFEKLVEDFPTVAEYRNDLGRCYFALGVLLRGLNKRPEAEAATRRAIDLHGMVVKEVPAEPRYRRDLADAYNNLGVILLEKPNLEQAEKSLRQAIALGEKLIVEIPNALDYRITLALTHHNLGNAVRDQGKAADSLVCYDNAAKLVSSLKPRTTEVSNLLLSGYWDRANALGQLRQHARAIQSWQLAIKLDATLDATPVRDHLLRFLAVSEMEVKLEAVRKPTDRLLFEAAAVFARATAAAHVAEEKSQEKQYARRALDLLNQARTAGWFRDPQRIRLLKDTKDFNSLPRDEFKRFLDSLEAGKAPMP